MSDNKHNGRGMFGKGYYIALLLCAAAIGISGYFYYQNENQAEPVLQQSQEPVDVDMPAEDYPVGVTNPEKPSPTETTQPQKKVFKTASPVAGQTVAGYAMETLSYNETTRDWRVHNGLDIGAEAGSPVCAAADGQVYTIYEDDLLGTTVVIRHEDGYTTTYASLSEELSVSVGDSVTVGQQIGTVGETALIETAMGPHVHFSVTHHDEAMDPAEFLALGSE